MAGYSGKNPIDQLRLLKLSWLLVSNETRGEDSTGVYGNWLYKNNIKASQFIHRPEYREAILGANTVIGHTRKATVGAKTAENAHPFIVTDGENRVVGTHNGWIFDDVIKRVAKNLSIDEKDIPQVDSEFVYKVIAKLNFDYDEALSQLEGAMALAFIRPDVPYLHLYKRESRPLYVGWDNHEDMYYSSIASSLEHIGCKNVQELDTHRIYVFHNGELLEVSSVKKPVICTLREGTTMAAWKATATQTELRAAGIPIVAANTNVSGRSRQLPPASGTGNQTGTGGATGDAKYDQCELFPKHPREGGDVGLLKNFNPLAFPILRTDNVTDGRAYYSGDFGNCTVIFKLVDTHTRLALPGWRVSYDGSAENSSFSAYNGLGVLEIPEKDCGVPVEILVTDPVTTQTWKTKIATTKPNRVLEVILSIPFRAWKKEKEKESKGKNRRGSSKNNGGDSAQTAPGPFASVLERLSGASSSEGDNKCVLRGKRPRIQKRSQGRDSSRSDGDVSNTDKQLRSESVDFNLVRHQVDYKMEKFFNEETDILKMDYYTAQCNRDEVEAFMTKGHELLQSHDFSESKARSYVSNVMSFLDYQRDYLKSAIKAHEETILNYGGD